MAVRRIAALLALACLASEARGGEAERAREAKALADATRARYGQGYETRLDAKRHIVYVSALDRGATDYVVRTLGAYFDAQRTYLFPKPLRWNIVVVVPTAADYRREAPSDGMAGYYDAATRTLTTISLTDTLRHEFTHALHHNDQAAAGQRHPTWIIEGLASLFQSAKVREGRIEVGPGADLKMLQGALREDRVPDLEALMATDPADLARDPELAYGALRYLMLYLHQAEKLRPFYEAYREGYAADRSGRRALEETLGEPLDAIDAAWRKWVLEQELPWEPGRGRTAHLGIRMAPAEGGVRVRGFVGGSAAQQSKRLKVGDLIRSLGGRPTPTPRDLTAAVRASMPGEIVEIEVVRDGETRVLRQVLGVTRP